MNKKTKFKAIVSKIIKTEEKHIENQHEIHAYCHEVNDKAGRMMEIRFVNCKNEFADLYIGKVIEVNIE